MRQLVGLTCTLCQKQIYGIVDGYFCPDCGCPVHTHCAGDVGRPQGDCRACGSPATVAAEQQRQEHEQAVVLERDVRSYQGFRLIGLGLVWLLGGLAVSLWFFVLSASLGAGRFLIATGAIGAGIAQICLGVIRLMRKGPPGARS